MYLQFDITDIIHLLKAQSITSPYFVFFGPIESSGLGTATKRLILKSNYAAVFT